MATPARRVKTLLNCSPIRFQSKPSLILHVTKSLPFPLRLITGSRIKGRRFFYLTKVKRGIRNLKLWRPTTPRKMTEGHKKILGTRRQTLRAINITGAVKAVGGNSPPSRGCVASRSVTRRTLSSRSSAPGASKAAGVCGNYRSHEALRGPGCLTIELRWRGPRRSSGNGRFRHVQPRIESREEVEGGGETSMPSGPCAGGACAIRGRGGGRAI